jgi:hypothetical protein
MIVNREDNSYTRPESRPLHDQGAKLAERLSKVF